MFIYDKSTCHLMLQNVSQDLKIDRNKEGITYLRSLKALVCILAVATLLLFGCLAPPEPQINRILCNLIVHDESSQELSFILANMEHPNYPPPMGVIRQIEKQDYTTGLLAQVEAAKQQRGEGDLAALYSAGETWTVS